MSLATVALPFQIHHAHGSRANLTTTSVWANLAPRARVFDRADRPPIASSATRRRQSPAATRRAVPALVLHLGTVHTSAVCGAVWDQARWLRRCCPHRQPGPFPLFPPPMRGARLCCPSAVVDGVRGLVSCSRASVTGGGGLVWCVWVGADYSSSVFHRKREKQRNRKTRRSGQRETTADVWLAPEKYKLLSR